LRNVHVKHGGSLHEDEDECKEEAESLQGICPNEGADAASTGVEPDEEKSREDYEGVRDADGVSEAVLEYAANDVELGCCAEKLAEDEERGSSLVAADAEAVKEVSVDGSKTQPIIEGQKDESDNGIANDEAHAHLEVSHLSCHNPSRHTDEGEARDACSDHAESH
jgi:hypothetical protein